MDPESKNSLMLSIEIIVLLAIAVSVFRWMIFRLKDEESADPRIHIQNN